MRKLFRSFVQIACVVGVFLCAFAAFALTRLPAFAQGKNYEVSFNANSSAQAVVTDNPFLVKLTRKTAGESVRFEGDRYEELKKQYRAKLVFSENVAGVENYYLYSPLLGKPVDLGGKLVNLHIAVSAEQTAAGTPLIFGGF